MATQQLEISTQQGTNGKTYKRINLKELEIGNEILIEKKFANPSGLEKISKTYGTPFWTCTVGYNNEEVGIIIGNKREYAQFDATGGVGDTIKVTKFEETLVNPKTKGKSIWPRLKFELVE
jgi:hypothetical protein